MHFIFRVASGGAEGIRETFSPFESPTMKVGIRTQILYLRTTLGREGDFAFDPDFVPNKKCDHNERLVAEDSLHAVMDHAIRTQTPVLFTLNGGIWADSAGQSLEWDINDVLEQDESLCQWNQFNQVMPDTALSNLPGSVDSPELGRSISLNVYMEKPRFYKKRNLQAACRIINAFREKHPSLFIGVNLDADVYMNPFSRNWKIRSGTTITRRRCGNSVIGCVVTARMQEMLKTVFRIYQAIGARNI